MNLITFTPQKMCDMEIHKKPDKIHLGMLSGEFLYLLKPVHWDHEDGGAFFALCGRSAGFAEQLDGCLVVTPQ